MYKIETEISEKLLSTINNIDKKFFKGINISNACDFYAFERTDANPDILTIEQINRIDKEEKYELLVCNIGIQLMKENDMGKILPGIAKCLVHGGKIIFNSLYENEKKEFSSHIMKDMLVKSLKKQDIKEISKYLNFIIRPYYSLTYWGYTFNKFNLKLNSYSNFQVESSFEELKDFYMYTYNNNILSKDKIHIWHDVILDSLEEWNKRCHKEIARWNFMPGAFQDWYTLEFIKSGGK